MSCSRNALVSLGSIAVVGAQHRARPRGLEQAGHEGHEGQPFWADGEKVEHRGGRAAGEGHGGGDSSAIVS